MGLGHVLAGHRAQPAAEGSGVRAESLSGVGRPGRWRGEATCVEPAPFRRASGPLDVPGGRAGPRRLQPRLLSSPGNYFASHFFMGGEIRHPHPEGYLFGENMDLNFLGNPSGPGGSQGGWARGRCGGAWLPLGIRSPLTGQRCCRERVREARGPEPHG